MTLITGGAGYIGSHVLLELAKTGEKVVVIDNLSTGHQKALLHNETFVQCDLSDQDAIRKVFEQYRPDTIIHFAAFINAPLSVSQPLEYYQNNFVNTLQLLKLASEFTVKYFVFSSTAAVYGSVGTKPVTENSIPAPLNPYGWSKLMSEQAIQDVSKTTDLRFAILRYFNVAGADPEGRIGQRTQGVKHLFRACLDAATGKAEAVTVYGDDYDTPDGTGVRDYIHVCDLASAHTAALEYLRAGNASQIFNVGYGKGYSVLEVIHAVESAIEKKLLVQRLPRRPGDAASVVANSEKLQTLTGWKPQFADLEKIAKDAWNWEQRQG